MQPRNECDCYKPDPHPLLRREIDLESELGVRSPEDVGLAHLYLVGLGYGRPWMNGQRIGARELDPAWTTFKNKTYYSAYDVTSALKSAAEGAGTKAVLGIELGNGFRSPLPMLIFGRLNFRQELTSVGPPIARAILVVRAPAAARKRLEDEVATGTGTGTGQTMALPGHLATY